MGMADRAAVAARYVVVLDGVTSAVAMLFVVAAVAVSIVIVIHFEPVEVVPTVVIVVMVVRELFRPGSLHRLDDP
jgi:hypothetical protein